MQFGYLENFSNIHLLAGIYKGEDINVVIKDLVFPYKTDVRDVRGFKAMPIKPAYELTFKSLLKENKIGIMADHVAYDAKGKARTTKGYKLAEGTMPNTAAHRTIDKQDYLKIAKALHDAVLVSGAVSQAEQDAVVVSEAQMIVGEITGGMISEHDNRITYMRGETVSTGQYTITEQNNPNEFTIPTISYGVPAANKTAKTGTDRWWTDAGFEVEGTTSNPMLDLRKLIDSATKTKKAKKQDLLIEVEYWTLIRTARHTKVRAALGTAMNPMLAVQTGTTDADLAALTVGMSDEQLIAAMSASLGVQFEVSDAIVSVQKLNKTKGILEDVPMTAFRENVFVCRRKGDIGEIHRAAQIKVGNGEGSNGVNTKIGENIYLTYKCDVESQAQQWDSSEITLLVLTDSLNMYYLNVV